MSLLVLSSREQRPRPTPVQRAPLPPFDPDSVDPNTGALLRVQKTINGTIPPRWSGYMRANLWGMTLPGLPPIPGGASGLAQSRMLTYLFDRYPTKWQNLGLQQYGAHGYEQFWRSIPDARVNQGIAEYLDDTKRIQDFGLIPAHFLRSKDFDGRNPDPTIVYPWIDALLQIDGIPLASHAWEASIFYDPPVFRTTIDSDATRYPSIEWCVHLQQGYAHYGLNLPNSVESARSFWLPNLAVGVRRLLYQYVSDPPDKAWSAGMMQARGTDVSVRLIKNGLWGLPDSVQWDAFELCATQLFNNERDGDGRLATEDTADLKGFECLCTPGPLPPSGFGNGARYPDGTAI